MTELGKQVAELTDAELTAQVEVAEKLLAEQKAILEGRRAVKAASFYADLTSLMVTAAKAAGQKLPSFLEVVEALDTGEISIRPYTPPARKVEKKEGNGKREAKPEGGKTSVAKVGASLGGIKSLKVDGKEYQSTKEAAQALKLSAHDIDKKGNGSGVVLVEWARKPENKGHLVLVLTAGGEIALEDAILKWEGSITKV